MVECDLSIVPKMKFPYFGYKVIRIRCCGGPGSPAFGDKDPLTEKHMNGKNVKSWHTLASVIIMKSQIY